MKLIRLINNNANGMRGQFDTILNEDITIEPNSEIALHSLTCEIDTDEFIIDAQNNVIEYKMTKAEDTYRSVYLTYGTYNSSNYENIFYDLSLKMNKLMQYKQGELGKQWEVSIAKESKKATFNLLLGTYVSPDATNTPSSMIGVKNCSFSSSYNGSWGRNGGNASSNDAFLYMNSPQCKGSSTLRGRIFQNITTNDGFIIGYLRQPPNNTTSIINVSDIVYGIRMVALNQPYKIIKNGVETTNPGGITPVLNSNNPGDPKNDYLSIDTANGILSANIYRDDTIKLTLFSENYDHLTDYYPVIIFEGNNTARLTGIKFTSDPYYNVKNTISLETELLSVSIPSGGGSKSIKTIRFNDLDLAKFFGFKENSYSSPDADNWVLSADRQFNMSDFSDSFILVLENLNIESYDGLVAGHYNLLHTIVQADNIRQRLTYTAPYPLFLSIRNPYQLKMRRFKAKLLREDLSEVALTGVAQVTLIIN
jgi:hypothetical protein